ncbi:UMP-CMP kinase 2, mitochondrial [Antechinus flavipes]|uniref:UMP-CMP kinase 2, mitochondrial n=1 Tax=Antechinus flavipes TaxID=38775 RepID=UPI0022368216|nr:UMP-CMP kinase 2, mitochondrial [Antechinus flavipes]
MACFPRLGNYIVRFLERMRPSSQVPAVRRQATAVNPLDLARDRFFLLELPDSGLANFTLCGDYGDGGTDWSALAARDPRLEAFLLAPGRTYSLCVPAVPGSGYRGRILAARLHHHLLQQLSRGPFRKCELRRLLCYSPDGRSGITEKGFILWDPHDCLEIQRALQGLLFACEDPRPLLGVFKADKSGLLWQRLWELPGVVGDKGGRFRVVPIEEPPVHPLVPELPITVVFPNLEETRKVFEECIPFIPEAKEILNLVDKCPKKIQKGKFPVIVIEGLDATGKTTVTEKVSKALKAVFLKSPPACVSQWRKIFDDEPTIIRRAYYSLGNYIMASEIAKQSTQAPVIIDRYWHSTAAYAIATEISGLPHHLPPAHHSVYQWPQDLLRPDIVLLLTVNPEERIHRIQGRGMHKTKEEVELENNKLFREKVEISYQRMENPSCHTVDANPNRKIVIATVLNIIRNYFASL